MSGVIASLNGWGLGLMIATAHAHAPRLACGPAQEHFPIVTGRWCDVAHASAAALRAIAARSPPVMRLVFFDGVLAVNGTTLATPRPAPDVAGQPALPLADLPLFAYRPHVPRRRLPAMRRRP